MEAADLMREELTLRQVATLLTEAPPMQEAVTLRVLQWALTEVALHQDGDDGCAIDMLRQPPLLLSSLSS